jgi:hypothetical protein
MRRNLPQTWDRKTVTKFLLFPRAVNYELRWLETATLLYEYHETPVGGYWKLLKFVDEEEKDAST